MQNEESKYPSEDQVKDSYQAWKSGKLLDHLKKMDQDKATEETKEKTS